MRWARRNSGGENNRDRRPISMIFFPAQLTHSRCVQIKNGEESYLYLSDVFWRQILNALLAETKKRNER